MLTKQNNPIIKKDPNPEPTSPMKDTEMKTRAWLLRALRGPDLQQTYNSAA